MTTGPVRLEPDDNEATATIERVRTPDPRAVPSSRSRVLRWGLPVLALALGAFVFWSLLATKPVPVKIEPTQPTPLVRVLTAEPEDVRLTVVARGTVVPRTESDLVAEVRGRVIEASPQLVEGGFFSEGDVLLRLDDREYRIALDRTRATVSLRESEARLATAEAKRRRELATRGAASASDLDQFESRDRVAEAALQEARAMREQAELDLERTVVRAPFDGRVRERNVDVGQFVAPSAKLARIFAVDYAEVRLPVRTDELAHLAGTLDFGGNAGAFEGAPVRLTARLGGRELSWAARIDRAEAAIDAQTRMLNLVARVDDPYGLIEGEGESGPPLPAGLFVTAEIEGRALEDVFSLPLMALRDGNQVFVFDEEGRLRTRDVSVVRRDQERVVIDGGIEAGEQIVISPLRIYSEGMQLRALDAGSS
jgi:multidrug efflux system membrane fusion protein